MKVYYSAQEAATILGVNAETIRRLLRKKEIIGKKIGRKWFVSCKQFDEKYDNSNVNIKKFQVKGIELFQFETFQQWVNKAASWFSSYNLPKNSYICVDQAGNVCTKGQEFMNARDNDLFPVIVYLIVDFAKIIKYIESGQALNDAIKKRFGEQE